MDDPQTSPDFASLVGADALLGAQRDVLEMIVRNEPLAACLDALCRIVETHGGGGSRAAIALVGAAGQRPMTGAAPSLSDADGSVAAWSMPIVASTGHVLGSFGVYFRERREPSAWERMLVEVLARTAALAIERERADRALRESEARCRAIVEASPECVKLVSADGKLLQMNPAGLRMLGVAEADVIGMDILRALVPEDRERFRRFHEQVCAGEPGTIAYDVVLGDGTRRSMESTAVPLRDGEGFAQLALTRDVTERRDAEHALAVSRARLDYAAQIAGIGFWYCDLPFDELIWDERVKEHFFLPPDARVTIDDFFDRMHPEDREPTRQAIERSIFRRESYDVVYRTVDPQFGAIKWIRALGGAFHAADGTPERFDGVTVDVTAQKRDERRLAALNERLREQDRRKNDFLATLAHELRNPLAPLRAGLEILAMADHGDDRRARTRAMMDRQLSHLVHMVDDLLDLSRITHGKVELRLGRIDVREALQSAVEATQPLVAAAGVEMTVGAGDEALPLDADSTRLAQVLTNIIHNSVKFTPPGGRIAVSAGREGDQVVVRVDDTGAGIPAEMLASIFDVFFQVDPPSPEGNQGLGIGLTLVRMFVELHGGTVEAQSDGVGKGSCFVVRLPLAAGAATTTDEPAPAEDRRDARERVLVIDDNVDAAVSLAVLLEHFGHQASVAHNGTDGLRLAGERLPDAAVIDIGLPDLNGYELAEQLRADPRFDGMRLIALTGWGTAEDRRRAHAAGFDDHLVKPVAIETLCAALRGRSGGIADR